MASFPDVPNFFFFSILSGIIVLVLLEIFRPEILGFKTAVRQNIKLEDSKKGIAGVVN